MTSQRKFVAQVFCFFFFCFCLFKIFDKVFINIKVSCCIALTLCARLPPLTAFITSIFQLCCQCQSCRCFCLCYHCCFCFCRCSCFFSSLFCAINWLLRRSLYKNKSVTYEGKAGQSGQSGYAFPEKFGSQSSPPPPHSSLNWGKSPN